MKSNADINTYITEKRERLTPQNYNEADALVFAELSYFPFEKVYPGYEEVRVSVPQFAADVMNQPGFEIVYSADKRDFIQALASSERYQNCVMHHMKVADVDRSQWAAFTADIGRDTSVIAMRGTDGTTRGWREDLELAHDVIGTEAQLASFRYLKNAPARNIYLTGHSKGGNNVVSAYVMSNAYIRDKIRRIDNFDGPGANPEFAVNYAAGYGELKHKLNSYYPQDSIIGMLLNDNPGNNVFIRAGVRKSHVKKGLLGQHDPFSFMMDGDAFIRDRQTHLSKTLDRAVNDIVAATSNTRRYYIVRFLERVGLPDLIAGEGGGAVQILLRGIWGIINALPEEKKALREAFTILIESLLLQGKEWIAERQMKGYNKQCQTEQNFYKKTVFL